MENETMKYLSPEKRVEFFSLIVDYVNSVNKISLLAKTIGTIYRNG